MSELGLADAISQLRREITKAVAAAKDEPLQFTLGPVELELQVELKASAGANVEWKWVVFSVGAEAAGERTRTHTVKLTLQPELRGRRDVKVGDGAPLPG